MRYKASVGGAQSSTLTVHSSYNILTFIFFCRGREDTTEMIFHILDSLPSTGCFTGSEDRGSSQE